MLRNKNKREKGFTIIETVISIGIFAIISMALLNMFSVILKSVENNKAMLTANNIATEELEVLRGMAYDNVETDTGFIPPGPVLHEREIIRNGRRFIVKIDVTFVDDPFDGLETSPSPNNDTFWHDYKKVRVRVSWINPITNSVTELAANTNIVPPGLEGLAEGFGGIFITVFDIEGIEIADADVTIDSTNGPYGPISGMTDANGNIWFANLPEASDYHIVVSKTGYSTEETYPVTVANPVPLRPNVAVISQRITKLGFSIDRLGSMDIKSVFFANPSNWWVNVNLTNSQTNPSMILLNASSCVEDPSMKDILVSFSGTASSATPRIVLMKLKYNVSTGSYNRWWPSDKQSVYFKNSLGSQLVVSPKDQTVYLVWSDDHDENGIPESGDIEDSNIYVKQINPSDGSDIGSVFAVSHDVTQAQQVNPSVAADRDGNLYITWEDKRNMDWDIYAQKIVTSPAISLPWGNTDFKVNDNAGTSDQLSPQVVTDLDVDLTGNNDNNFYVTWKSAENGNFDIFLNKFNKNHNPIFSGAKKINSDVGSMDQFDPDIAFGADYLYVVWADDRESQPDIFMQKMSKNGSFEWSGINKKVNDDTFMTANRVKPSIAYRDEGAIYVSWEDTRNGSTYSNIYTLKVDSADTRQWEYDFLAADELTAFQTDPVVICDSSGMPVTIWEDNRRGTLDIFGTRYGAEMGNVVQPSVPVTITSRNYIGTTADDPPVSIPKFSQIVTTDVAGHYLLENLEWGEYDFAVNDTHYCLVHSIPPSPVGVLPNETSYVILDVCHN